MRAGMIRRLGFALLPAIGLWTACEGASKDNGPKCPDFGHCFFADGGFWVQGDTHVHTKASNDADPGATLDLIKPTAFSRGLDFIVLTDHSNSTGSFERCAPGSNPTQCVEVPELFNLGPEFADWDRAAELSEPGRFLVTCGNEISPLADDLTPRGHVGVYPFGRADFDRDGAIVDRPAGAVTGGAGVAEAHRRGAFAVVNHPYSPGGFPPWTEYDWTDFSYEGMEVYNGSAAFDSGDQRAVEAWLCDLARGRRVAPVGASDNHNTALDPPGNLLNPPLGAALTSVYVKELTWSAIEEGFRSGRTIAHDGANLIDFRAENLRAVAIPGDSLAVVPNTLVRITYRGRSERAGEVAFYMVREGGCRDHRGGGKADFDFAREELHRASIPAADALGIASPFEGEFFIRYAGTETDYVYAQFERDFAPVWNSGVAVSSAVALRSAGE